VVASTGGEATPKRKNGGDDTNWVDANLIGPKMKKIHVIDSVAINRR
jgi:hypothetical protein